MRIAVDARELQGRPTGVGRYVTEIVQRWAQDSRGHEVRLYGARDAGPIAFESVGGAVSAHLVEGRPGTLWEQWTLPRALKRDKVDVLFAPAYSAPLLAPCPVVLTMHDVSFCAHPEWFAWREGVRRRQLAKFCADRADALLTVSKFSAGEIVKHLSIAPARVEVVTNGVDHVRRVSDPAGRWLSRPPQPHVVSIGSIFNRRHVPTLIDAFANAFADDAKAHLSIAGENRTHPRLDLDARARDVGIADRTHLMGYASDVAVAELLESADIAVFVSDYEGFGLPMLEALARGVPVVVADTDVSHEVCEGCASYVKAGDVRSLSSALRAVMDDRHRLAEQLSASTGLLDRYRWDMTATLVLDRLETLRRT